MGVARLCGGSAREFVAAQSLLTDSTVRPYVVALAYLLGGFTDFHHLGMFNRFHLACLIFGEPRGMKRCAAPRRCSTGGIPHQRGHQQPDAGRVQPGPLLLNRSPRLEELTTTAFDALRAHPATDVHQGSMLYALQRVVAELGQRSTCAHRLQPRPRHSKAPTRYGPSGSNAGTPPRR